MFSIEILNLSYLRVCMETAELPLHFNVIMAKSMLLFDMISEFFAAICIKLLA